MPKNYVHVVIRGGAATADPLPDTRIFTANVLVDDEHGRFLAEAEARIKRNLEGLLVDVAALQEQIQDSNLLQEVVAEIRRVAASQGLM